MFKDIKLSLVIFILISMLTPVHSVRAQEMITFSETTVTNHFPNDAVFSTKVTSNGAQIISAQFVYSSDGYYSSNSYSKVDLDIRPGQNVDLEFTWVTRGTVPWSYLTYYWDVVDADGNHYRSEQLSFRYDDIRYKWQVLENNEIGVWWHDRSASFGQGVFDIAVKAVRDQRDVFQVNLDYPVRIVIYNTFDEFAEFQGIAHEWVGGQTYSDFGVTVQIVESSSYQSSWLMDVIPHEISHLYFAQATHNPAVSVPHWLNEGVSQYNEYTDHVWDINQVQNAAKKGKLIPLSALASGFGAYNEERIYLSYAESWSAVDYFAETYGEEKLGALLQAYKQGQPTEQAFQTAIGKTIGEFETEWAKEMGVPDDFVTPTPWAFPTFRPAPTMAVIGQAPPTREPTPVIVSTQTPVDEESAPSGTSLPCTSFAPVLMLGLGTVLYRQNRKNKNQL